MKSFNYMTHYGLPENCHPRKNVYERERDSNLIPAKLLLVFGLICVICKMAVDVYIRTCTVIPTALYWLIMRLQQNLLQLLLLIGCLR